MGKCEKRFTKLRFLMNIKLKNALKPLIGIAYKIEINVLNAFISQKIEIDVKAAFSTLNSIHSYRPFIIEGNNDIEHQVDLMIIIPAYNVEKYIKECIESVLCQKTHYKYRIVIIDDGSTDSTAKILDSFVNNDIHVIHQKNKGIAFARNVGLKKITGKYLMFLDADDRLMPGALQCLLDKIEALNADIVEGGSQSFTDEGKTYNIVKYKESLDKTQTKSNLRGQPWGKVIRADLFKNLKFPEGYDFEDSIFAYCIYPSTKQKYTVKELVYEYRTNDTGITKHIRGTEKSIDTYYVSMELWKYYTSKFPITTEFNIKVLDQIALNYRCTQKLGKAILSAGFQLEADFYQKTFANKVLLKGKYKKLDSYIRNQDWGKFQILCKAWPVI